MFDDLIDTMRFLKLAKEHSKLQMIIAAMIRQYGDDDTLLLSKEVINNLEEGCGIHCDVNSNKENFILKFFEEHDDCRKYSKQVEKKSDKKKKPSDNDEDEELAKLFLKMKEVFRG